MKFGVGEGADLGLSVFTDGFGFPDEGWFFGVVAQGVAVDAVEAEVELAVNEPLGYREIPVEDFGPGLEPAKIAGGLGPEGFGIGDGAVVEGFVFGEGLDVRGRGEFRRRRKDAVFAKDGVEVLEEIDEGMDCEDMGDPFGP